MGYDHSRSTVYRLHHSTDRLYQWVIPPPTYSILGTPLHWQVIPVGYTIPDLQATLVPWQVVPVGYTTPDLQYIGYTTPVTGCNSWKYLSNLTVYKLHHPYDKLWQWVIALLLSIWIIPLHWQVIPVGYIISYLQFIGYTTPLTGCTSRLYHSRIIVYRLYHPTDRLYQWDMPLPADSI